MEEFKLSYEYLDWLFGLIKREGAFVTNQLCIISSLTDEDKENIAKLTYFMTKLELEAIINHVKVYTFFGSVSNTRKKRIYFSYKGTRFIIEETIGQNSNIYLTKAKRKDKHKYLEISKVIY